MRSLWAPSGPPAVSVGTSRIGESRPPAARPPPCPGTAGSYAAPGWWTHPTEKIRQKINIKSQGAGGEVEQKGGLPSLLRSAALSGRSWACRCRVPLAGEGTTAARPPLAYTRKLRRAQKTCVCVSECVWVSNYKTGQYLIIGLALGY